MRIRTRLTLLYATAFFIAGAILIVLNLFYLRQSLAHRPGSGAQSVIEQFIGDRGRRNFPVLDSLLGAVADQAEADRRETMRAMLLWSLVSLGLVGLAAGGLGWLLAGRVLHPLQDVTATARRVAERNLHERIALTGPDDEIKELADTFDAMLARLDRAFDGQHRFVANASHELRTPLAINRTLIEVALEDPQTPEATRTLGRSLLAVNERQARLIDGLLLLASSEQHLQAPVRVDMAQVARRAIEVAGPAAGRATVVIRANLTAGFVIGDPVLLERLAQNLVDNAVRYNLIEDGWVTVNVTAADGLVWLSVHNSGPLVAPDDVDALFEPFRRGATGDPDGTGGTGLGLSIVRSVTNAHGGFLDASARPGGGLTVAVGLRAVQ